MKTRVFAVALIVVLSVDRTGWSKSSQHPPPAEQVRAIGAKLPVEVRFLDGSKLRGWIDQVSDTGFVLMHEKNHQLTTAHVDFSQVEAVRRVKSVKPSHTARNLLIGAGVGLATLGIIFGVYVRVHGLG